MDNANEITLTGEDGAPLDALRWSEQSLAEFSCFYDIEDDVFFAHENPNPPAVSLPVGRHAWLRYDPDTRKVVGMEVEDYERLFLARHPEFRRGWEAIKPRVVYRPAQPPPLQTRDAGDEETAQYGLSLISRILEWHIAECAQAAKPRKRVKAGAA